MHGREHDVKENVDKCVLKKNFIFKTCLEGSKVAVSTSGFGVFFSYK